jgi:enoyl-CoA hydratase/carnithine racemase
MKRPANYKWEKEGDIGILSISNPPGNLISMPDFIEEEQLNDWLNDKTIKGILILGAGRHFSAGADLDNLRKLAWNKKLLEDKMSKGRKLIHIIGRAEIPVVAAIRGACFGGGLEIALACHVRICSENSMFAFPEINHGLIPGLGGSAMLSDLTGEGRSLEIILSGNVVDAQKALELRITDYVVPAKETESFALKYLENLTHDRDVEIIRSVMKSIHNSRIMPFEEALREETKLFCKLARKNLEELK